MQSLHAACDAPRQTIPEREAGEGVEHFVRDDGEVAVRRLVVAAWSRSIGSDDRRASALMRDHAWITGRP
jgi:hypothetical protein